MVGGRWYLHGVCGECGEADEVGEVEEGRRVGPVLQEAVVAPHVVHHELLQEVDG